ncbi:P-loop NTPase fold protein, partial [Asanoa siamensis]|uniref:P-loop NTPase fold protein n=1 Tax=Asanoa siamensis TaxID=926357 RepID=UPI001941AA91
GERLTAPSFILLLAASVALAGCLHTARRFFFGYASTYLPADLFHAPVLTGAVLTVADSDRNGEVAMLDPAYRSRAGRLAMWQQSVEGIVDDLRKARRYLVICIDDLDRCSPKRTAAVFEAMNQFMSGQFDRTRFVMAVDPTIVAAHLKTSFKDVGSPTASVTDDDPDIGWAFLRKLVQLPVMVPAIGDPHREAAIDRLLRLGSETTDPTTVDPAKPAPLSLSTQRPFITAGATSEPEPRPEKQVEHDPMFASLLLERLEQRPACTMRELKRLLTVWVFYVRVTSMRMPLAGTAFVQRACDILVLAEIVTRWPALQKALHRSVGQSRVLTELAQVADDPTKWETRWGEFGFPTDETSSRISGDLRALLHRHRGAEVAKVAASVL